MAEIRNIGRVATTMNASDGSSVQINAGYHGKVEDKFLWGYDASAIHVFPGKKSAAPTHTYAADPVVETPLAEVAAEVTVQVEESTSAGSAPSFRGSNYDKRK